MDLVLLGAITGVANGLLGVGIVLIHRATRVINLAHGEIGAFGVAMVLFFIRVAHLPYALAVPLAIASCGVLGAVLERSILRRLANSPRLIVLIATIGMSQLVTVLRLIVSTIKGSERSLIGGGTEFPVPFHSPVVAFGRVTLRPEHLMLAVVGPALAIGLFAFLRFSAYGIALRASAENATRARLLGIPVGRVSTLAWVLSSVLAGSAAILLAPVVGFSTTAAVGLPLLMRGLAAATVARYEGIGTAFQVGVGLGILDELVFHATGQNGLTDVVLFVVVLGALIFRSGVRRRTSGAEESSWELAEPSRPLPVEIRTHPRWRVVSYTTAALAGGAILGAPVVLGGSKIFLIASISLIAVVGLSVSVLTGWAGQLSIGQWGFAGVGGVIGSALVTRWHVSFWLALLDAAIAAGAMAFVLGLPALRLEGSELAVVTLGFAVAASTWLFNQDWFRGDGFLPRPSYLGTTELYFVCVGFLAVSLVGARALQNSRVGRTMVAVRDNPAQAASMGISVVRAKLTAFVLSGFVAGAAGFLFAAAVNQAQGSVFPPERSLEIVTAVVIGGLGSISGAVVGSAYLLGVPYFGGEISPYIGLLSTGIGLLALLLFLPGGLTRVVSQARDRLAKAVTGIDPRPDVVPQSTDTERSLVIGRDSRQTKDQRTPAQAPAAVRA